MVVAPGPGFDRDMGRILPTLHRLLRRGISLSSLLLFASPAFATMPPQHGPVPDILAEGFKSGLFSVPAPPGLGTQQATAVQSEWVVPVILVDFTDQALRPESTPAHWDSALFDTTGSRATGSVFDYYKWVSGGRLRITGKVVATIHLSGTKNFYANSSWGLNRLSTPRNIYGAVGEALAYADQSVNWAPYDQDHDGYVDMVWVVHSGFGGENIVVPDNLWSITSTTSEWANGGVFETNDPFLNTNTHMRISRFSVMPELSAIHPGQLCEIGVFCHEFGHALGLPDLYDTNSGSRNVGPGNWSLMSTGSYGTDGQSPEYPAHMGAWPSLFLGWTRTVKPTTDTLIVLPPLENGGPVLDLWFQGESSPEHFLVENRQRLGFDRNLPSEGLIVYHVDDGVIGQRIANNKVNVGPTMGYKLVEADGHEDLVLGPSHGDDSDPFPGSAHVVNVTDDTTPNLKTNTGAMTNLALTSIGTLGDNMRFNARVRSRGWSAARQVPGEPFTSGLGGRGARLAHVHDGDVLVSSEARAGGPAQVMIRRRSSEGVWTTPEVVSQSPTGAIEPTIASLPGDDLAIAWSDTRHGANEIYYRALLGGHWTPEVRLTDRAGSARAPSIAADDHGGIHLAWQLTEAGKVQVLFLFFPASAPLGDPIAIPGPVFPDVPLVTAGYNRSSFIIWSDRGVNPNTLWFARFHPDSGLSTRYRLAPNSGMNQTAVGAAVDGTGALHSVWVVPGSFGANELHYQWRQRDFAPPLVRDTVLERRGEGLQNPTLAIDPLGGLHIAFELSVSGIPQIRYRQWDPTRGWDVSSTEVTLPTDGFAAFPVLIPIHPLIVTVIYNGNPGGTLAWLERTRNGFLQGPPTAVDDPPPVPRPGTLRIAPNPLPNRHDIQFAGALPPLPDGARLGIFDLAGRRVASAELVRDGARWTAKIGGAETGRWEAGVYFARVDGLRSATRFVVLR